MCYLITIDISKQEIKPCLCAFVRNIIFSQRHQGTVLKTKFGLYFLANNN